MTDKNALRKSLRERFPRNHGQLLPALHFLSESFGYLPEWALEVVGWHLGIPASEVYGATTSYSELRLKKPGVHILKLCTGLSCQINGSQQLLDTVESELQVPAGQTTEDDQITVESTPCGYLCSMAPAAEWDGTWIGRATPTYIKELIQTAKADAS